MRTVTFAELDLVAYLRDNFITVWHNQTPENPGRWRTTDDADEQRKYPQGGGGSNLLTFFCTPDGRLLFRLEGYWTCERYLREAYFAQALAAKLATVPEEQQLQATIEQLLSRRASISEQRRHGPAVNQPELEILESSLQASIVAKQEDVASLLYQAEQRKTFH